MKIRKRSVPSCRSADIPVRSKVNGRGEQSYFNAGRTSDDGGWSLIDLLVVLVILAVLAILVYPSGAKDKAKALRISCVNNLKQTGLSYRIWEGDHGDFYPQDISQTNGGTMELMQGLNAFRAFQIMSNELSTPKVVFCPNETDRNRFIATNFVNFNNSNVSYFVGLDASNMNPDCILSGDRNITNSTPLKNGILELTPNKPAGWTAEIHNKVGNILLADGSVQQESTIGLRSTLTNSTSLTNRLLLPILSQ